MTDVIGIAIFMETRQKDSAKEICEIVERSLPTLQIRQAAFDDSRDELCILVSLDGNPSEKQIVKAMRVLRQNLRKLADNIFHSTIVGPKREA